MSNAFTNLFAGNGTPYSNANTMLSVGLGLLSGKTPNEQIANAASNFANERMQGRAYNKTLEFLRAKSPELAQTVEAGAMSPVDAFKVYHAQQLEAQKPKNNFLTVGKNLYDTNSGQWVTPPAGAAGDDIEAGLNLVYGKDADGRTVGFQPLKSGGLRRVELPDGVDLTPGLTNIDTGTGTVTLNSRTGVPMMSTPKDLSGKAQQTEEGKLRAEAQAALPQVEASAGQMLATIDSLASDQYLPNMLGAWDSRTPNWTSNAARVQGKMDQIGGQSFLQAFNMLRGAGQITEIEGQKATNAMARLNTAQSVDDYKAALDELRGVVNTALSNARTRAGGGAAAPGTTKTGVSFTVED